MLNRLIFVLCIAWSIGWFLLCAAFSPEGTLSDPRVIAWILGPFFVGLLVRAAARYVIEGPPRRY